ncbi:MAG: pyruvate formate lyase-activating protein [Clostridiales bacterium]|nr:pyruvate formate lyase-activating protein [Clostridiales bacterium]
MQGNVHSIETFGTVDGPGIRFVIFMQGCELRCAYCHNPDTWICGKGTDWSTDDMLKEIVKYKRYIQGVTVSGGEPLLQIDFVTELFAKVKAEGLDTCIDTSGVIFDRNNPEIVEKINSLLDVCDLVMLDIKHIREDEHIELTGKTNANILDFAKYLSEKNKEMWLRYVLVPTINDREEIIREWKAFADTLNTVKKIEVLPYHRLALEKYKNLGIDYRLKDIPEPTKEQVECADKILNNKGERQC